MQINFQEEIAVFNLMKQIWFGFFSFKCNQIGSDNNLLTGRPKKGGNVFFFLFDKCFVVHSIYMHSVCFIDVQGLKSFKSNNAYSLHMALFHTLLRAWAVLEVGVRGPPPPPFPKIQIHK